ncbi:MAG: type II and III secretion system protein [Sedimentisphaerales bacterium]|nr:type II and III secretion system protein [Sedimentisphaerales bacterium]
MAPKYIGRTLSGGVMALCIVLLFTPQTYSQAFTGRIKTFHISGTVGLPGVTMQGLPGSPAPTTDENGVYSVEVRYGWSGTVTPVRAGYTFEPKQRAYTNITEDKTTEDYTPTMQTFTIAGTTDKSGVKLRGLPDDPNSDADGRYRVTVPYGWSGTVVPELRGFQFEPASRDYAQISENKINDSYSARIQMFTISGSVGTDGVLMGGFPTEVKTNKDGAYQAQVPYEWSGKVTPVKEGHDFSPQAKEYHAVTDNYPNEDYIAQVYTFEISGSAGMEGVLMAGLPGDPISDMDGRYVVPDVPYGWFGKITPTKAGYSFKPATIEITKVTENKPNQDFTATIVKYTISGTTAIGGVKLMGLPTDITSGSTGSYSATVEYGWSGTITPDKEGYVFDPQSLFLGPVEKDLPRQDFRGKAVTFTISGNVGQPGVMMQGLPGRVVSDQSGIYSVEVPYKWKGSVTPIKEGYMFEPDKREYMDMMDSATSEDYTASVRLYTVSGRITSDRGALPDVVVMTDKQGVTALTDANGDFALTVEHGWQGKLQPQKDGCNFTPISKPVGPVTQNLSNQSFIGKMRMVTITDRIVIEDEPVQGVKVTAKPGDYTATTDAKGKYTVQVPFGWTGELWPTKAGFEFYPASILYQNVIENVDATTAAAKPPAGDTAATLPATTTETAAKPGEPVTEAGTTTTTTLADLNKRAADGQARPAEPAAALTDREKLDQLVAEYKRKLEAVVTRADANLPIVPQGAAIPPAGMATNVGPIVSGSFAGTVIEVLTQISQRTGAKVAYDATVKPDPIQPVTITAMPMASALPMILSGTKYTFRRIETPEEVWQVFLPITNSFAGDELRRALTDISIVAGVPIIPDETVTGQVWADLQGYPLELALETILAGSPYVVKRTPNYYLVADRKVESGAFPRISETRRLRLNYIAPMAAKALLSQAFTQYVQADTDPNSHIVTVTAPTSLADRIVKELKDVDIRPRHVLLDARIVAMERGDLLNIGVEWGMPTAQAGFFGNAWERGNQLDDTVSPAGMWPWGIQVGLTFDKAFTNSLTAALNLLKQNSKADIISSPQVMGRDGRRSRIQVITEEYFMMTAPQQNLFYSQSQLENIKSGTTLDITPLIGDNNDITLEMAVEVSDSIPQGRGSDLPVVTRRTAQNSVTIRDGGTVAVAGLTENRTKDSEKRVPLLGDIPILGYLFRNTDSDKATREIAIFITAHLVPETSMVTGQLSGAAEGGRILSPATDSFKQELKDSLSR